MLLRVCDMAGERKASSGSAYTRGASPDYLSDCGMPSSATESDQPVVKVCKSSEDGILLQKNEFPSEINQVLEVGEDPCLNEGKRLKMLNPEQDDLSMVQFDADSRQGSLIDDRNDSISRLSQILEEDEDPCLVHREKRLKMSNPEPSEVHVAESFADLKNSSLLVVEAHHCNKDVHMTIRTSESGLYSEISEKQLLHKALGCNSAFDESSQNNDYGLVAESNRRNEKNEMDMLTPKKQDRMTSDGAMDNLEHTTIDGHELIVTTSSNECSISCSHHLDTEELPSVINFVSTNNEEPSDCGEEREFVHDDSLCWDIPSYHADRFMAMDADISMKNSEGLTDSTFQGMTGTGNAAVIGDSSCSSRKKLLVLDVNGLLVAILSYIPYDYDFDEIINRKAVFMRPHCHDFLKFCFENFTVGIWTSRTKRNIEPMVDFILGDDKRKLAFTWDHSHCTDSGFFMVEKKSKPLLLKQLKKLWNMYDPDLPWEKGDYDETNTVLVDDTPSKALSNPPYNAIFPFSFQFTDVTDNSLGPGGDLRIYLKELAMAENVQEYIKQHPFGQRPISEKNLSWRYYLKVIEAVSSPPRQDELNAFQEEHNATDTDEVRE